MLWWFVFCIATKSIYTKPPPPPVCSSGMKWLPPMWTLSWALRWFNVWTNGGDTSPNASTSHLVFRFSISIRLRVITVAGPLRWGTMFSMSYGTGTRHKYELFVSLSINGSEAKLQSCLKSPSGPNLMIKRTPHFYLADLQIIHNNYCTFNATQPFKGVIS